MQSDLGFRISRFAGLCLATWAVALGASAQTGPSLGLQFYSGQPSLSLTGAVGAIYSIQYATGISPTNLWTDRALVQIQGAGTVWTDPSASTSSARFYRVVSVVAPADTNLVFIQPGTFTMGSPSNEALRFSDETQHAVTISKGFWLERYLVTQGDYLAVVENNPSFFQPPNAALDLTRPVEFVSWSDATNYCALRTAQEVAAGLIPVNCAYRLPTESEWEYAVRAGTTTTFYVGSGLHSGQANFDGQYEYEASVGATYNPGGIFAQVTTPVGSYTTNAWGLSDMVGNVFEWCQDWYNNYPAGPVIDPQGPASGSDRLVRGGSWVSNAQFCRSAQRYSYNPVYAYSYIGFRVVLAQSQ